MEKPFVLGINGSPHKEGIVSDILQEVLNGAKDAGAETETVYLYELRIIHEPGYYSEDPKKEVPERMPKDDIVALYPKIRRADGLVLATPVYWANMSGVMKDFIDHLTALENKNFQLLGKVAAFIAATQENAGGLEMANLAMVAALGQMGVLIPPNGMMWYPSSYATAEGSASDWAKEDAPIVGRNMVKIIELLKTNPIKWSG